MSAIIENNVQHKLSHYLPRCEKNDGISTNGLVATIKYWYSISRQRKHLARLDDRMLADIGLTKAQAKAEIAKPFWK